MFIKPFGFLAAAVATVSAYDVGCLYPAEMNEDLFLARRNVVWGLQELLSGRETPYVVRFAHQVTMCQSMCASYHTPGMLDPLTKEQPLLQVPDFGQNGYAIIMCTAQCNMYTEFNFDYFNRMKGEFKLEVEKPSDRPDIADAVEACGSGSTCRGSCGDLCTLVFESDYSPYIVGHLVGIKVREHFANDGWNAEGDMQYSPAVNGPVPCTSSCRQNQDTTGYYPQPNPRKFPDLSNDNTKYECTGRCRRWQPLQENDEHGNLIEQSFTAVQIGEYAETYLREPTINLEDPQYDLYLDSLQVIEEVKLTSENQTRKDAVALMDNKGFVRRLIQDEVIDKFGTSREMSFQEYTLYLIGISSAEIDGVIQAWKEKRHHDLVRPTTVIKHWDDDILFTFGGDREMDGPVEIAARDFEAFIRVMPHAEFPSGSSCLCTAYMEFTDEYLNYHFGRSITDFGSIYNNQTYANLEELRDICSVSRLWGGMHYTEAVPAGQQVCEGLGMLGVDYVEEIRNGVEWPNPYFRRDPRPVCGDGE
jgi:hypothetical protein